MTAKPRAFFFHFNKPRSKALGKPQVSLHFDGSCHIVDNVVCVVPVKGKVRPTQPVFVITGKTEWIQTINNVAYLGDCLNAGYR